MTHENILNLSIENRIEIIRESQLSLASYLKENKETILHNSKSMYIITLRISCKRIRIYLYILKYRRI